MCEESHLSLEFITKKDERLLLYNGPLVAPEPEEIILSDFISLELEKENLDSFWILVPVRLNCESSPMEI